MSGHLKSALQSENFRTAAIFGVSGLAFAAANIILASVQAVNEYAIFTLSIAVITLFASLGQFGADGVVNRHDVAPDARMFARLSFTTAVAAIVAGFVVTTYYDIGMLLALLLGLAIISQSTIYFVAAYFRSHHDFRHSLLTFNSSNYIILIVAVVASVLHWESAFVPIAMVTCLLFATAFWSVMNVRTKYASVSSNYAYNWREAIAYVSIVGSGSVLIQLERLVTPKFLTLADLATLGVLLAIVGPPFRLLHMTLGYVLLPKLRKARTVAERNALIVREIVVALGLLVPCWIVTWYLVPILEALFFDQKYQLTGDLIFAVIFAGTVKVFSGIGKATLDALASTRHLEVMAVVAWIGLAVSTAGAWFGARYGLAGIVYGVSLGWIVRLSGSVTLVSRQWQSDREITPPKPGADSLLP